MTSWRIGALAALAAVVVLMVAALPISPSAESPFALPGVVAATVGALIVSKRPGNGIGLFLLAAGVGAAVFSFSTAYAASSVASDPLPAAGVITWIASWMWAPFLVAFPVLLMIYPSRRPVGVWRWVSAVLGVIWIGGMILFLAHTAELPTAELRRLIVQPDATNAIYGAASGIPSMALLVGLPVGVASLVHRWVRGAQVERQQIKWLAVAGTLLFSALLIGDLGAGDPWWQEALWLAGLAAFPVAIGIAILRHNLFDIDRIINRTVVYTIVVAMLGALFGAGAVWLPTLLPVEGNNVAVAAATLAVFFLFNPLRRGVQRFVDMRFYRSRYDTQQVVDEFAVRLRDQVDPGAVADEWVDVVRRTLRPASVSVWVEEEA